MPTSNSLTRRHFLQGGLKVLVAASAAGVLAPPRAFAAPAAAITTTQLTPKEMGGLTLFQGAGCNVVALPGPEGALMIDGGLAANSKVLLRAVTAATGTRRVDTLINTHWHPAASSSRMR